MNSDPSFHMKYIRRLIVALAASGLLNILLVSLIVYWIAKETPPTPYIEQKPALKQERQAPLAVEAGNAELIHYFRSLDFHQLVEKLSNRQLIENGYAQRDIALACLVTFHQFDLSRALLGHTYPEQQRQITYGMLKSGKPAAITVYPELSDNQYAAIIDFAVTERWPLTAKGLFWQIKKQKGDVDATLRDAFYMTPEFLALELLLNRSDLVIPKEEILNLIGEGSWTMLSDFSSQQKLVQDLSPPRRQRFLLDYIDYKSKTAALILIKVDNEFALKKLDDKHVTTLLHLLTEKTSDSEKYAVDLLKSPRSDTVWKTAAALLYRYEGETVPDKFIHHMAMKRFVPGQSMVEMPADKPLVVQKPKVAKPLPLKTQVPKKAVVAQAAPPPKQKPERKDRQYIVQEGDTLWKVSRRFNVHIDALRSYNKLKSDALQPGTQLRIP
jgi:LysM repeat protein